MSNDAKSEPGTSEHGLPPGYESLRPSDRAAVHELVRQGADMRKPRQTHHHLFFTSAAETEQASTSAAKAGWRVSTSEPGEGSGRWMLTCEKDDYVLLARVIHADTRFFDGLATFGHGEHDGWDASVN